MEIGSRQIKPQRITVVIQWRHSLKLSIAYAADEPKISEMPIFVEDQPVEQQHVRQFFFRDGNLQGITAPPEKVKSIFLFLLLASA